MSARARRRPWTVFVHSIGPTFTFATEERAVARARDLVVSGPYASVIVYQWREGEVEFPLRRRRFTPAGETVERLIEGAWTVVPASKESSS